MSRFEEIAGMTPRKAGRQCLVTLIVGIPVGAAVVWEPGIAGLLWVLAWAGACFFAASGLLRGLLGN